MIIIIIITIVIMIIKEIQAYKNKDQTAHNIPKQNNFVPITINSIFIRNSETG